MLDEIAKIFKDEGTVFLIPHSLICPTCGDRINLQRFVANERIICDNGDEHIRLEFAKQFGIIKNLRRPDQSLITDIKVPDGY